MEEKKANGKQFYFNTNKLERDFQISKHHLINQREN